MIEAARAGKAYGASPYVVAGTGQEQMRLVGWLEPTAGDCATADPQRVVPIGSKRLAGGFGWSAFTQGEDVMFAWLMKVGSESQLISTTQGFWPAGPSGDCIPVAVTNADGFAEGEYTVVAFAGPDLRQVATGVVTTGQQREPPSGVILTGRILDTTTGNGIAAAGVVVLLPGTDVKAWAANATDAAVAAYAETGSDGSYTMSAPLTPGTAYPLLVVADGYQPLIGTLTPGAGTSVGDIGLAPVK